MKFFSLKRPFLLWGYTSAAVLLLFIVGVAVSLWVSSQSSSVVDSRLVNLPLGGWRAFLYSLLVLFWPRLIGGLTSHRRYDSSDFASRRPLVVLIILYECLIVQNPLAYLLDWVD